MVPQPPISPLGLLWTNLGRIVAKMLGERAHVVVSIIMKDGKIQLVRFDRSVLPDDLSKM